MLRAVAIGFVSLFGIYLLLDAQPASDRLARYRNLGKAFYENPATQKEAIEPLRQALALAPNSAREQLNYGLALLRAGETEPGIAQIEKAQKTDPKLPHTWFNLGVTFQKQGDFDKAFAQFQGMIRLVPDEPVSHYHVGALLKLKGDLPGAIAEFIKARDLNPRLAAPHFQLYGLYRQTGKPDEGAAELKIFQDLKKQQEGAAVPEDMDWSWYAEIYDPLPPSPSGVPTAVFRNEPNRPLPVPDAVFVAAADYDNDGLPDLCVITKTGAWLYHNDNGKLTKRTQLAEGQFNSAFWIDYDHDYDPDLILLGPKSRLFRNNGEAGFSDETKPIGFVSSNALSAERVETDPDSPAFDFVIHYDSGPVLYKDKLGGVFETSSAKFTPLVSPARVSTVDGQARRDVTPGNWVEIALTGVKNAKMALDTKVEVKAGDSYQRAVYRGEPLLFHLGSRTEIDTIRITWANGLVQNEVRQPVNKLLNIKEAPRLSGSCPMIFTWNGGRFQFITDVLGVAPLGASSGDGSYFPVDHDEYVSIPGAALQPRDGKYEIRVTEELHEVTYLDQVKLIALDHPAKSEIVTNEKFKSPPFPEFRLFGVERKVLPIRRNEPKFRHDAAGVAEMHTLDLDFGNAAPDNRAVLVLHGWVDWADGSTFLAASQSHRDLRFPYVQVKDTTGAWRTVVEDMGIPSGKPKMIAVDLASKFLSASREVRIVTNLCVYWDDIFLIESDRAPEVRMATAPLAGADLHFRGFSKAIGKESFDYDSVSTTSMWNPTKGNYTRYGDVESLLAEVDDRLVVMGSGDEVRLQYAADRLPPLPAGWTRDFLLLVDGWAKDADPNTAFSQTVLPLPFHKMVRYGDAFPLDLSQSLTRPALRLIRPLSE